MSVKIGLTMKYFICFIAVLFVFTANAQSDFFGIKLNIFSEQVKSVFTVEFESSKEKKKMKTNSKGMLALNSVSYDEVYNLTISKNNFVTKTIKIDAKKGYYGDKVASGVIELEIDMIEALVYVDYEIITNSPVGLIEIAPETGSLENNKLFATKRKNEIEAFLKNAEIVSKEMQSRFKKLLKSAKNEIYNNKFKLAESFLLSAEKILINKETIGVRELLVFAVTREGDEVDAVKKIIAVADKLLTQGSYNESVILYKRVIRLDPKNNYAQEKINEINVLLVNMEKENNEPVDIGNSTSEILSKAKIIQENRIDSYYSR